MLFIFNIKNVSEQRLYNVNEIKYRHSEYTLVVPFGRLEREGIFNVEISMICASLLSYKDIKKIFAYICEYINHAI